MLPSVWRGARAYEETRAGLWTGPRRGGRRPRTAASMAATSILRIVIIASKARVAAARSAPANASVSTRGVICHDRPQRSLHQPHFALLAAVAHDGVPQAVGLGLVVGGDLEREGLGRA